MDTKQLPPPDKGRDYEKEKTRGFYRSFDSEHELRTQCGDYFKAWTEAKRPLTLAGLCVYLRISKETLSVYMRGTYDDTANKYSDALREAKLFIEMEKVERGLTGEYNPHITKFDLTNNHGYKEKTEVSGDSEHPLEHNHNFDDPEAAHRAWQEAQQEDKPK